MKKLLYKLLHFYDEKKKFLLSKLRICLLRSRGACIGKNVRILGPIKTSGNLQNIYIEDNVTLNVGVFLGARGKITIKENSTISGFTKIVTGKLTGISPKTHDQDDVIIGNNVWIAINCCILAGSKIGSDSVISANTVISGEIDKNSFVKSNDNLQIYYNKLK